MKWKTVIIGCYDARDGIYRKATSADKCSIKAP